MQDDGKGFRAFGQLGEAVLHEAIPNHQPERNRSPTSYRRSVQESKAGVIPLPILANSILNVCLCRFEDDRATDAIQRFVYYDVIMSKRLQTDGEFLGRWNHPALGPGEPQDQLSAALQAPSFSEALRFWFKLGWISFGGTAAHIAIMQDELVQKKRWISNGRFLHALSHCMVLPGPEAQQLAIYVGWKLHGKRGGVAAGTLFVLPSMFVLLALSLIYAKFGNLPWVAAMFNGLKPAVIALVIIALHRVARSALRAPLQGGVAAAAFAAMFLFNVSLLLVMLGSVLFGIVLGRRWPGLLHRSSAARAGEDEGDYYIGLHSVAPEPAPFLKPAVRLTSICFSALASAASALLLLCWRLPFLEDPGALLYQDGIRNHWRLVHSHSLRGASYGIEAALAEQFSNDGRLRVGGNDARTFDHCGGFCWIHGRVQPLPRLAMDGYAGPAGHNLLHISTVLSLRVCRCPDRGTYTK